MNFDFLLPKLRDGVSIVNEGNIFSICYKDQSCDLEFPDEIDLEVKMS
ncbi:MAG: hypothetical protein HKM04_08210 [Legionellales bacterium]|nr:hypothetical protein [Legionellales bacterium]